MRRSASGSSWGRWRFVRRVHLCASVLRDARGFGKRCQCGCRGQQLRPQRLATQLLGEARRLLARRVVRNRAISLLVLFAGVIGRGRRRFRRWRLRGWRTASLAEVVLDGTPRSGFAPLPIAALESLVQREPAVAATTLNTPFRFRDVPPHRERVWPAVSRARSSSCLRASEVDSDAGGVGGLHGFGSGGCVGPRQFRSGFAPLPDCSALAGAVLKERAVAACALNISIRLRNVPLPRERAWPKCSESLLILLAVPPDAAASLTTPGAPGLPARLR